MANYYRRFIPHASELQALLTDMLKRSREEKGNLNLGKDARAFQRIKNRIAPANATAFLSPSELLALHTDAWETSVGATLNQLRSDGTWVPLRFFL